MKTTPYLILISLLGGLFPKLWAVEPQPPLDLILDPDVIQSIRLHPDVDVLLLFPAEVTLITGQGLTTGETPGQVQFQQGEGNPRIISLRMLKAEAAPIMHVALAEQVFVFRLTASDHPATLVRFQLDPKKSHLVPQAIEIGPDEAKKSQLPTSFGRLKQMADLVRQESSLRGRLPEAYPSYQSYEPNLTLPQVAGLSLQIHRIARFAAEDTLVFFGTLQNNRKTTYRHSSNLVSLKVGDQQAFPGARNLQARPSTPAGESTHVWVLLAGDGQGNPLHLSLKNQFTLQLNP